MLLLTLVAQPTRAAAPDETAEQVRARAERVAARVERLTAEYTRRTLATGAAAGDLATAFDRLSAADGTVARARERLTLARSTRARLVRDLYVNGMAPGTSLTLLTAGSPDDALWRLSTGARIGSRLLADADGSVLTAQDATLAAAVLSAGAQEATRALSKALGALRDSEAGAESALGAARTELGRLDGRARQLTAARQAAAALAAAQQAAAATRLSRGPVSALGIPAAYLLAYQQAATTCPGMDWTLLAGVGQVESGHGRNNGPSSAGAIGPMQFMPRTFAGYAVDGDGDGRTDPWDPQDAIFTAARYLCTGGAGQGPAGVHAALLRYNHAEWYVDLVLAAQASIRGG